MAKTLVCFESGHYKEINGKWLGDKLWAHHYDEKKKSYIHINKDKVEYIEVWFEADEKDEKKNG